MNPVRVDRIIGQNGNVAVLRCQCGCGLFRLIHIRIGTMMLAAANPSTLLQLTHEFHLEAVKRTGALVG